MWNCSRSANNLDDFFHAFISRKNLALLLVRMSGHAFRIVTASTIIGLSIFVLGTLREGSQQLAVPQAFNAKSPITYFIADGNGKPGYHSSDRELAQWALQAWERSATNEFRFASSTETGALIRVYWAGPDGGEYGETRPTIV